MNIMHNKTAKFIM